MTSQVDKWVRAEIRRLSAYHVPDASGLVKLDAMENPYGLSKNLRSAWLRVLADVEINRYPDPQASVMTQRLRSYMNVPEGMSLITGNGSDELIQIMAMTLAGPGRKILSVEPGFVMYKMIATFSAMDYVGVPLAHNFSLDMAAMSAAIEQHQPALVFLAYPNNPTGNLFKEADVTEIIKLSPGLVVIDEAYHPFAQASFMSRLGEFNNLLVMRTISKLGLAGLRLGMVAGDSSWLDEFNKVRLPYNVNSLTQASASFILEHDDELEQQAGEIRKQREILYSKLGQLDGLSVFKSSANFLMFRVSRADEIFESLKSAGILIKNLHPAGGMLENCLRVTVGTPDENVLFLDALRKFL